MARRHAHIEEAEINITPMLDVVFIMLIFFYRDHVLYQGNRRNHLQARSRAGDGAVERNHPDRDQAQ
jgi:biopolymer transport protein ExbD